MFDWIEKLRQKTDREKKKFAFLISILFSSSILFLWYFAVFPDLKEQKNIDDKIKNLSISPTESLSSVFSGKLGEIKSKISEIKNVANSFSATASYYSSTSTATTSVPVSSTTELKIEETTQ